MSQDKNDMKAAGPDRRAPFRSWSSPSFARLRSSSKRLAQRPPALLSLFSILFIASGMILWTMASVSAEESSCGGYDLDQKCLDEKIVQAAEEKSSEDTPVQNLYLTIYQNLRKTPSDAALKVVAEQNQYTTQEIQAILDGNLALLVQTQGKNFSNEDAADLLQKIKDDYNKALEDAELEYQLALDASSKEIFANGNTGDSGFDLIYDLEIIELLLFEDQGATTPPSDFKISLAPTEETEEDTPEAGSEPASESSSEGASSTETVPEASDEDAVAFSTTEGGQDEPIDPTLCAADEGLQNAFDSATDSSAPDEAETSSSEIDSEATEAQNSSEISGAEESTSASSTVPSELVPAASGSWLDKLPCGDIFCLVINFINEKDPQYLDTSNCIQCHVEHIIKALSDTTSVGLTPGKVPGNLFEPAFCKRALTDTGINLNFIHVAVPIQTPGDSKLVTGLSFCDTLGDFVEDGGGAFYGLMLDSLCEGDLAAPKTIDDKEKIKLRSFYQQQVSEEIKRQKNLSPPDTSFDTLFDAAQKAYETEIASVKRLFEDQYTQARMVSSGTDFFDALSYEMDQMTFYFESFKALIGLTQQAASEMEKNLKPVE